MGHLLKKNQGAGVTLEIKVQFIKSIKNNINAPATAKLLTPIPIKDKIF